MRAVKLENPGGLDNLKLVEIESTEPQIGEIRIRNHASLLNFHDYVVAIGVLTGIQGDVPTAELFQKNAVISGITVGSRSNQMEGVG